MHCYHGNAASKCGVIKWADFCKNTSIMKQAYDWFLINCDSKYGIMYGIISPIND